MSDTSVVVLNRDGNEPLIVRSNPTDAEVRDFAEEHNRRHGMGEPGGMHDFNDGRPPATVPAQLVREAHRYESEVAYLDDPTSGVPLSLDEDDEDLVDEEE